MRRGGFTLLELGIVLSVAVIFLTAIAGTAVPLFRAARAQRTGNELQALAKAAANALKRNLLVDVQPIPNAPNFRFKEDGVNAVPVTNAAPLCYNLARYPNTTGLCPANGKPGAAWSSNPSSYPTPTALPANSPMTAMVGGDRVYSNGFNAWCEPYVVCLFPFHAEVLTCVPRDELNSAGLVGSLGCGGGGCAAASPLTGEPMVCAMVSAPTFSQASEQLKYSYSTGLNAAGTAPSALPNIYADKSPRF